MTTSARFLLEGDLFEFELEKSYEFGHQSGKEVCKTKKAYLELVESARRELGESRSRINGLMGSRAEFKGIVDLREEVGLEDKRVAVIMWGEGRRHVG